MTSFIGLPRQGTSRWHLLNIMSANGGGGLRFGGGDNIAHSLDIVSPVIWGWQKHHTFA